MTVAELIEKLKDMPQDVAVVYEGDVEYAVRGAQYLEQHNHVVLGDYAISSASQGSGGSDGVTCLGGFFVAGS